MTKENWRKLGILFLKFIVLIICWPTGISFGQSIKQVLSEASIYSSSESASISRNTNGLLSTSCIDFQFTGSPQQWVVPPGVDTIRIKMWGGAGGAGPDSSNNSGGGGGYTEATLAVSPGQVLDILVGGGGGAANGNTGGVGAWPNGGSGGLGNRVDPLIGAVGGSGGGGGRSEIQIGGVIYVIAGAGGGGSYNREGGGGGGFDAEFTPGNNQFNLNGFGGNQISGGAPASNVICGNPVSGTPGSFLQGGLGASDTGGANNDRSSGGGGGDGYYGGGGGSSHDGCFGVGSAGGGGSGYLCSTCPGFLGTSITAGISGLPANNTDSVLTLFPGIGAGQDQSPGGYGLVYICYDFCIPTTSITSASACDYFISPSGLLYTSTGIYNDTISNSAGCDSVIIISLTIFNSVVDTVINVSACDYYNAPWGATYTQSGLYVDTLSTINGCDSVVSVNLTINYSSNAPTIIANACDTYISPWGAIYTQSGLYYDTLSTVYGCDSIVSLNLNLNSSFVSPTSIITACDAYTSNWGTVYTQSGIYYDTLSTIYGCDSILSLDLTINNSIVLPTLSIAACDSFVSSWGATFTQSGLYYDTLATVYGCDSIVSLNLTLNNGFVAPTAVITACDSYASDWGIVYTQSGLYYDTLSTIYGCDSILSLDLTINNSIVLPALPITACDSFVSSWGTTYNQSGIYVDSLITVLGCDSIISVDLTIYNSVVAPTTIVTACDSYATSWGSIYNQSGLYVDTIATIFGCDSVVSIDLTVLSNSIAPIQNVTSCNGFLTPWGDFLTQSGIYSDTIPSVNGCDSIISINLTVYYDYIAPPNYITACDSYLSPWGLVYNQSGTYSDTLTTLNGCDSILTVVLIIDTLQVMPTQFVTACNTYSSTWGQVYDQTGFYTDTLLSVNGCDSIVSIDLTITGPPEFSTTIASPDTCDGNNGAAFVTAVGGSGALSYNWSNGISGPLLSGLTSGSYTVTVTDQDGCSNVVTVDVGELLPPVVTAYASSQIVVSGGSVQLAAAGAYTYQWSPTAGLSCFSCQSTSISPMATSTYTVIGTDINGCSSFDTITVYFDATCKEIFVPNIFSPNNNGPNKNEYLCVYSNCIEEMDFVIFNRWGKQVYQSNNPNDCWDGTFEGKDAMTGVYAYRLYIKQTDGVEVKKIGNVTLAR